MYVRKLDGVELDFNHRGWLYEETYTFYDRKTDSLWAQATGRAIAGHYKGRTLERLPSLQTTWREWRTLHPGTLVLGRPLERTRRYHRSSYESYYQTGRGIKYQRHAPLHLGLAVVFASGQMLFPFEALEKQPVLVTQIGGEPVLVVFHAATKTATAWDPRIDGAAAEFRPSRSDATDLLLADSRSNSIWSGLTGKCVDGPHKGKGLRPLLATKFIVENWELHYPKSPVYGRH